MAAETQYTANTGLTQITTANASLTGSGTLNTTIWSVITGASNGTLVKSITVKSIATTAEGMVRIFLFDGANTRLLEEIHIPANVPSATNPAFEYTWNCDFKLKATNELRVTTQVTNTFNIIADGLDWAYFTGAVRSESTNFTANTGSNVLTAANTSLTGSGTLNTDIWSVITAGASATFKGCRIESINIKARVTTTDGMVRFFLFNGSVTRLFKEVPIYAVTQSATEMTFETTLNLNNYSLKAGWEIRATTQNAQAVSIVVEGNDWRYPAAETISSFTPASGTNVVTEELLHSLQVPANLLTTGDVLRVFAELITNNNANAKTFRISVNTTSTLVGATRIATVAYTTTTAESFMRLFPVISTTSLGCHGGDTTSGQTQYEANTGTTANVTVPNVASGFFILISGQKAVGTDTDTVQWSMAKKENN